MTNEIKLVLDLTQFEQSVAQIDTMVKRAREIWLTVDKVIPNLEERLEIIVREQLQKVLYEEKSRKAEITRLQGKTRKLDKELKLKEEQKRIINAEIIVLVKHKKEAAIK